MIDQTIATVSALSRAPAERAPATALVPAVERAARLLDHLAAVREPLSLADLARALGLPKSSVHGLLATLVNVGLAHRGTDGSYKLGPKSLEWAGAYSARNDLVTAFHAQADADSALQAETVMLAVLDGPEVFYLACRQGPQPLAVNFRVGGRLAASCASSGKAMLATMPESAIEQLFAERVPPRLTTHSIVTLDALQAQLRQVRIDGFAVDDEETAIGMQCFGAPVFAAGRTEAVAAVAVSMIKASTDPARRDRIVSAIRGLAGDLSRRLGWSG